MRTLYDTVYCCVHILYNTYLLKNMTVLLHRSFILQTIAKTIYGKMLKRKIFLVLFFLTKNRLFGKLGLSNFNLAL